MYGVIGVQEYSALICENEKNEKNQHPNPAQQEYVCMYVCMVITYSRV